MMTINSGSGDNDGDDDDVKKQSNNIQCYEKQAANYDAFNLTWMFFLFTR